MRVASDLREAGHDVWLDTWKIRVGDSISAEIERGIEASQFLLLLLSNHAATSKWVEKEWRAAYWQEVETRQVKVLPVLLEHCPIPGLLRDKNYASMFPVYEQGLETILAALEHHSRETRKRSFYSHIPALWRDEIGQETEALCARNEHWDRFDAAIWRLRPNLSRLVVELNTRHYLAMYGLRLRQLKLALQDLGFYDGEVDDTYDERLPTSLERFQRTFSLRHVDGVFGPLTYAMMAQVAQRMA